MLFSVDRKELVALIEMAQLAHDDLIDCADIPADLDTQQMYVEMAVELADKIEAWELGYGLTSVSLSMDLIYFVGLHGKINATVWDSTDSQIVERKNAAWQSMTQKLSRAISNALILHKEECQAIKRLGT